MTRQALISEIAPDLINQQDAYANVQNVLKKEFGEDFEPDRSLADRGDMQHYRYFKRLEKLLAEAESNGTKTTTLKELKARQAENKRLEMARMDNIKREIMDEFKVDEAEVNNFFQWAANLKEKDYYKMYSWAKKTSGGPAAQSPSLGNHQGAGNMGSAREQFLNTLKGL